MSRIVLTGVSGANPLGFMASVGLLRVLSEEFPRARLGFLDDGSFHPFIEGVDAELDGIVAADAKSAAGSRLWKLECEDLKPAPDEFAAFMRLSVAQWIKGRPEGADYAAAFASSVNQDNNGNTKPTEFHFTAGQQLFLRTLEKIRALVTQEWAQGSLIDGGATRSGPNLRWDPGADRSYALMAGDPTVSGTVVDAPLEWLAFRSLPWFPTCPGPRWLMTSAVQRIAGKATFLWPLWSVAAPPAAVRSLVVLDWDDEAVVERNRSRGVWGVCSSQIKRANKGYGNFGPASVSRVRMR